MLNNEINIIDSISLNGINYAFCEYMDDGVLTSSFVRINGDSYDEIESVEELIEVSEKFMEKETDLKEKEKMLSIIELLKEK